MDFWGKPFSPHKTNSKPNNSLDIQWLFVEREKGNWILWNTIIMKVIKTDFKVISYFKIKKKFF